MLEGEVLEKEKLEEDLQRMKDEVRGESLEPDEIPLPKKSWMELSHGPHAHCNLTCPN